MQSNHRLDKRKREKKFDLLQECWDFSEDVKSVQLQHWRWEVEIILPHHCSASREKWKRSPDLPSFWQRSWWHVLWGSRFAGKLRVSMVDGYLGTSSTHYSDQLTYIITLTLILLPSLVNQGQNALKENDMWPTEDYTWIDPLAHAIMQLWLR